MGFSTKRWLVLPLFLSFLTGCNGKFRPDRPKITTGTRMEDVRVSSHVRHHEMTYRVILPDTITPGAKLPVLWLLHGAGVNYRDWSNSSDISKLALQGVILVMPDDPGSYFVNSPALFGKQDEDYLLKEIIPSFREHFPAAATDRAHNGVIGISRGGFSAVTVALRHPELFGFVAGVSAALDLAERPFRWHEPLNSWGMRRAFGAPGVARASNDPFALLAPRSADTLPYIYLVCGTKDILLPANKRFYRTLKAKGAEAEFHIAPGGHDWGFWNQHLPAVEASALEHLGIAPAR